MSCVMIQIIAWKQKINSLGFQVGKTRSHHSLLLVQPKVIPKSKGLKEDQKILAILKNCVERKMRNILRF